MSKTDRHYPDDGALVAFLQQHKPIAPPTRPGLEQAIMHQIALPAKSKRWQRWLWLLPVAIAATATAAWLGSRPPDVQLSEAEREKIEQSLLGSWSASLDQEDFDSPSESTAIPASPAPHSF